MDRRKLYLVSNSPFFDERITKLDLCEIKFNKFRIDENFQAIVFTSKNGVKALQINSINPYDTEIYTIGEACANAASKYGFKNIYIAKNSHGNDFADEISPLLKGKKTLFIKAKNSVSDVEGILRKNGVCISVIEAYENKILSVPKTLKPPKYSRIIFTSPSNIRAFIKNFGWDDSYEAICIGKTTAKFLPNEAKYKISSSQSIISCVNLALYS